MDAAAFLADLDAKPDVLAGLADRLAAEDLWSAVPSHERIVLVGMGSSAYAAGVAAARLRAAGIDAVSELASSDLLPPPRPGTVVVAVSAGGGSRETVDAVSSYAGKVPVVLLTERTDSDLAALADVVVGLGAGEERGGVACRSYQHTIALLLALESHLTGGRLDVPTLVRRSAEATEDLLGRRDDWLPLLHETLLDGDGTHVVAPARRLASAQQSALMLREGPRLPAVACETGDWSHVDVYLTKTTAYRMLLLAGSGWEDELLRWTTERRSTVVAVGADVPGATWSLRYRHDEDDDVRLLTETLVAELLAADGWLRQAPGPSGPDEPGARERERERLEMVDALVLAGERRAELTDLVAAADNPVAAVPAVQQLLGVSATAAMEVLNTQLRRWTTADRDDLVRRRDDLRTHLDPPD